MSNEERASSQPPADPSADPKEGARQPKPKGPRPPGKPSTLRKKGLG